MMNIQSPNKESLQNIEKVITSLHGNISSPFIKVSPTKRLSESVAALDKPSLPTLSVEIKQVGNSTSPARATPSRTHNNSIMSTVDEDALASLLSRFEKLEQAIRQERELNNKLSTELSFERKKTESIQEAYRILDEESKDVIKQYHSAEVENEALRLEKQTLLRSIKEANNTRTEYDKYTKTLEGKIRELEDQLGNVESMYREELEATKTELEEEKSKFAENVGKVEDLRKLLAESQKENASWKSTMESSVTSKQVELDNIQEELQQAKDRFATKEVNWRQQKEEFRSQILDYQTYAEKVLHEREQMRLQNEQLRSDITVLHESTKGHIKALEEEKEELLGAVKQVKLTFLDLQRKHQEYETAAITRERDLQLEVEKKHSELLHLRHRITELNADNVALNRKIESSKSEVQKSTALLSKFVEQLQKAREAIIEKDRMIASMKNDFSNHTNESLQSLRDLHLKKIRYIRFAATLHDIMERRMVTQKRTSVQVWKEYVWLNNLQSMLASYSQRNQSRLISTTKSLADVLNRHPKSTTDPNTRTLEKSQMADLRASKVSAVDEMSLLSRVSAPFEAIQESPLAGVFAHADLETKEMVKSILDLSSEQELSILELSKRSLLVNSQVYPGLDTSDTEDTRATPSRRYSRSLSMIRLLPIAVLAKMESLCEEVQQLERQNAELQAALEESEGSLSTIRQQATDRQVLSDNLRQEKQELREQVELMRAQVQLWKTSYEEMHTLLSSSTENREYLFLQRTESDEWLLKKWRNIEQFIESRHPLFASNLSMIFSVNMRSIEKTPNFSQYSLGFSKNGLLTISALSQVAPSIPSSASNNSEGATHPASLEEVSATPKHQVLALGIALAVLYREQRLTHDLLTELMQIRQKLTEEQKVVEVLKTQEVHQNRTIHELTSSLAQEENKRFVLQSLVKLLRQKAPEMVDSAMSTLAVVSKQSSASNFSQNTYEFPFSRYPSIQADRLRSSRQQVLDKSISSPVSRSSVSLSDSISTPEFLWNDLLLELTRESCIFCAGNRTKQSTSTALTSHYGLGPEDEHHLSYSYPGLPASVSALGSISQNITPNTSLLHASELSSSGVFPMKNEFSLYQGLLRTNWILTRKLDTCTLFLERLEAENATLRSKTDALNNSLQENQMKLLSAQKMLQQLKTSNSILEKENLSNREEISASRAIVENTNTRYRSLLSEFNTITQLKQQFQQEFQEVERKMHVQQYVLANWLSKYLILLREQEELEVVPEFANNKAELLISSLREEITLLTDRSTSEKEKSFQTLHEQKLQLSSLKKELELTFNDKQAKELELVHVRQQLENLEERIAQENNVRSLQESSTSEETKELLLTYEEKYSNAKRRETELLQQLEKAQDRLRSFVKEFESYISRFNAETNASIHQLQKGKLILETEKKELIREFKRISNGSKKVVQVLQQENKRIWDMFQQSTRLGTTNIDSADATKLSSTHTGELLQIEGQEYATDIASIPDSLKNEPPAALPELLDMVLSPTKVATDLEQVVSNYPIPNQTQGSVLPVVSVESRREARKLRVSFSEQLEVSFDDTVHATTPCNSVSFLFEQGHDASGKSTQKPSLKAPVKSCLTKKPAALGADIDGHSASESNFQSVYAPSAQLHEDLLDQDEQNEGLNMEHLNPIANDVAEKTQEPVSAPLWKSVLGSDALRFSEPSKTTHRYKDRKITENSEAHEFDKLDGDFVTFLSSQVLASLQPDNSVGYGSQEGDFGSAGKCSDMMDQLHNTSAAFDATFRGEPSTSSLFSPNRFSTLDPIAECTETDSSSTAGANTPLSVHSRFQTEDNVRNRVLESPADEDEHSIRHLTSSPESLNWSSFSVASSVASTESQFLSLSTFAANRSSLAHASDAPSSVKDETGSTNRESPNAPTSSSVPGSPLELNSPKAALVVSSTVAPISASNDYTSLIIRNIDEILHNSLSALSESLPIQSMRSGDSNFLEQEPPINLEADFLPRSPTEPVNINPGISAPMIKEAAERKVDELIVASNDSNLPNDVHHLLELSSTRLDGRTGPPENPKMERGHSYSRSPNGTGSSGKSDSDDLPAYDLFELTELPIDLLE